MRHKLHRWKPEEVGEKDREGGIGGERKVEKEYGKEGIGREGVREERIGREKERSIGREK